MVDGDHGDALGEEALPAVDHLTGRGERLSRPAAGETDAGQVVEDDDVGVEPVMVQAVVGVRVCHALDDHARQGCQQVSERRLVEAVATRHDERPDGCRRAARAVRGRAVVSHPRMVAHDSGRRARRGR